MFARFNTFHDLFDALVVQDGWILVEADNADACYEHAAEWAECLDWEVTPVLSDEQAGPLIAKAYS